MNSFDVAIIGAGPAGATCAGILASKGFSTAIIEKKPFPRRKVCAGGITRKAANLIPFNIFDLTENRIDSIKFRMGNSEFVRTSRETILWTVEREVLDARLVDYAVSEGSEFLQDSEVTSIAQSNAGLSVNLSYGTAIICRIAVGAYGADSRLSRLLGLDPFTSFDMGIEGRLDGEPGDNSATVEWGIAGSTYIWSFPKSESASLGIKGPKEKTQLLNSALRSRYPEAAGLRAHAIPFRLRKTGICSDSFLLIGDAAGLADPWTGEGVYHALKSAKYAAEAIQGKLGEGKSLSIYQQRVDEEILPEQRASAFYQNLFNLRQKILFDFIEVSDWAWDAFCGIVQGERRFPNYFRQINNSKI